MRASVWWLSAGVGIASIFALGVVYGRASSEGRSSIDQMTALRAEVSAVSDRVRTFEAAERSQRLEASAAFADRIKTDLANEMGLVPLAILRERRSSFVAVHALDPSGETKYGTAGYLGNGYFLTVKHLVFALDEKKPARPLRIVYRDAELPAVLVDAGDAATEVDPGDWAIVRTDPVDLPALQIDTAFGYDFAEPIVRFGNDYSKGIVASSGYVGQRTPAGLVTCLTDGHPGVSGGGVLDRRGVLVGIPIGRMRQDYRFSFILPLRDEMFRKVRPFQDE